MAKADVDKLLPFLQSFPAQTQDLILWLRDFAWAACPYANELIYDNYNALAVGWSLTETVTGTICSIAAYRAGTNLHFGFYWGNLLTDPSKKLVGKGSQYRYVLVNDRASFDKEYITQLIYQAHTNSLTKIKDEKLLKQGLTVVKTSLDKRESLPNRSLLKRLPKKRLLKSIYSTYEKIFCT